MPLYNIIGEVGSGKTIYIVYYARLTQYPVYTNFEIKIPNWNEMRPEVLIKLDRESTGGGSMVALDEAYSLIESRGSAGKTINAYLSYLVFQARKRNMFIFTTDQLLSSIDVRFRDMANYEIHCEAVPDVKEPQYFKYKIYQLARYKKPRVWTYKLDFKFAERYLFKLYDTYKTIDPIDQEMIDKISVDKTDIIKEIDSIVDKLLLEMPAKAYTLRAVKAYCLDNNIYAKRSELIYNKIHQIALKEKYKNS
jgi:hypothetical protein